MIIEEARRILLQEGQAILDLAWTLGDEFSRTLEAILELTGRLIVLGVGKSGLIGRKIASTLASTGTPAFFIHPTDALHGDIGMVTKNDLILAISHSGESKELLALLPVIRRIGAKIIAVTGNPSSLLGKESDYLLHISIKGEACPLGLAPSTSSTATLALGDALALTLAKARGFKREDFALFHPAGSLGHRLLRVKDVLAIRNRNPLIKEVATIDEALFAMTDSRMGAVSVVDELGLLVGIITDGDIRRGLGKEKELLLTKKAKEIMTQRPLTITEDILASQAIYIMEEKEIGHLPVVDKGGRPLGLVNYQDLFQAGVI